MTKERSSQAEEKMSNKIKMIIASMAQRKRFKHAKEFEERETTTAETETLLIRTIKVICVCSLYFPPFSFNKLVPLCLPARASFKAFLQRIINSFKPLVCMSILAHSMRSIDCIDEQFKFLCIDFYRQKQDHRIQSYLFIIIILPIRFANRMEYGTADRQTCGHKIGWQNSKCIALNLHLLSAWMHVQFLVFHSKHMRISCGTCFAHLRFGGEIEILLAHFPTTAHYCRVDSILLGRNWNIPFRWNRMVECWKVGANSMQKFKTLNACDISSAVSSRWTQKNIEIGWLCLLLQQI